MHTAAICKNRKARRTPTKWPAFTGSQAAHGHYKANGNLQKLVSQGLAKSPHPAKETVDLAAQLIKAGVPGGYYDMGHYLELGYGVEAGQ